MKNRNKLKLIILGIVFAFFSFTNYNFYYGQNGNLEVRGKNNSKIPRKSGYWPNCPPIFISNDNWATVSLPWVQNLIFCI